MAPDLGGAAGAPPALDSQTVLKVPRAITHNALQAIGVAPALGGAAGAACSEIPNCSDCFKSTHTQYHSKQSGWRPPWVGSLAFANDPCFLPLPWLPGSCSLAPWLLLLGSLAIGPWFPWLLLLGSLAPWLLPLGSLALALAPWLLLLGWLSGSCSLVLGACSLVPWLSLVGSLMVLKLLAPFRNQPRRP